MNTAVIDACQQMIPGNSDGYKFVHLWHLVQRVIRENIPGEFVELGCYQGDSARLIALAMKPEGTCIPLRKMHVFDSFEGMPELSEGDAGTMPWLTKGVLQAREQEVIDRFESAGVLAPTIHKGWFKDTIGQLPEQIAFAHLDGDFYDSILVSLEGVYPRLSPGAVCVIDDVNLPIIPGARRAAEDFFQGKPEAVLPLWGSSQYYFVKE